MELVLLGSRVFPLLQMRRHPNRSSGDACRIARGSRNVLGLHHYIRWRLLLDSRVVDVAMAYGPPFVMLSSLKPFFFNSLKHTLRFSDNTGA